MPPVPHQSPPHLKVEELVYDLHLREWQVWSDGTSPTRHVGRARVPLRETVLLSVPQPERPAGRSKVECGTLEPLADGNGNDGTVDFDLDLRALPPAEPTPHAARRAPAPVGATEVPLPLRWAEHSRHPAFRALSLTLRILRPLATGTRPHSGLLGPAVASIVNGLPQLLHLHFHADPLGPLVFGTSRALAGRIVDLLRAEQLGPVTPENIHHERVRAIYYALLVQDAPALADALRTVAAGRLLTGAAP